MECDKHLWWCFGAGAVSTLSPAKGVERRAGLARVVLFLLVSIGFLVRRSVVLARRGFASQDFLRCGQVSAFLEPAGLALQYCTEAVVAQEIPVFFLFVRSPRSEV